MQALHVRRRERERERTCMYCVLETTGVSRWNLLSGPTWVLGLRCLRTWVSHVTVTKGMAQPRLTQHRRSIVALQYRIPWTCVPELEG